MSQLASFIPIQHSVLFKQDYDHKDVCQSIYDDSILLLLLINHLINDDDAGNEIVSRLDEIIFELLCVEIKCTGAIRTCTSVHFNTNTSVDEPSSTVCPTPIGLSPAHSSYLSRSS